MLHLPSKSLLSNFLIFLQSSSSNDSNPLIQASQEPKNSTPINKISKTAYRYEHTNAKDTLYAIQRKHDYRRIFSAMENKTYPFNLF